MFFILVCHLYCICLSLWSFLVYSSGHWTSYFAVQQRWVLQASLKFLEGEIYLWTKLSLNTLPAAFKNFACCLKKKKRKRKTRSRHCFQQSKESHRPPSGCPWPLSSGHKWSSAITGLLHSWNMTGIVFFLLPRISVSWDHTLLNWLEGLAN